MKKTVYGIIATLVVCAALSGCRAKNNVTPEPEKAEAAVKEDVKFEPGYFVHTYTEEIEGQDVECKDFLILMDDGKGFYSVQDIVDLTWNWKEINCSDGTKLSIKPDGENLIVVEDGREIKFTRTYEELPEDLYERIDKNLREREFSGNYTAGDDTGNPGQIIFTSTGSNTYDVILSLKGFDEIKGDGNIVDGGVEIGFTAPDNSKIYSVFFPVCDTYTLRITQSDWDKIKPETDFTGFVRK